MQIILSKDCLALQGLIGRDYGYHIECRKQNFYAVRNAGHVPPDGHWRFIVLCAELAQLNLHIADIKVMYKELKEAIVEAKIPGLYLYRLKDVYDADDILTIKSKCGL